MKESFLIDVLKGMSPFHCVEAAMQTSEESGFEELEYARPWNLKRKGLYDESSWNNALCIYS